MRRIVTICCSLAVPISISWGENAYAQTGIGCGVDSLTRATLESAKTSSEDAKISSARALIENWQTSLPTLMAAIENMQKTDASKWQVDERRHMIFVVGIVKTILASK